MTDPPEHLDDLLLRRDALTTGRSDGELARLVRAGGLSRLRRGAYLDSVLPATAAHRHRVLIRATMAGLRRPAVVSHQSAAVLHDLPLWGAPLDRIHLDAALHIGALTHGALRERLFDSRALRAAGVRRERSALPMGAVRASGSPAAA
jgi:hypothetical protein